MDVLQQYQERDDLKEATFADMFRIFPAIAEEYNKKTGKNGKARADNTRICSKRVLEILGLPDSIEYRQFNSRMAEEFLKRCRESGKFSAFTSVSYLESLRALGARWTQPYYENYGLRVRSLSLPPPAKTSLQVQVKN